MDFLLIYILLGWSPKEILVHTMVQDAMCKILEEASVFVSDLARIPPASSDCDAVTDRVEEKFEYSSVLFLYL